MTTHEAPHALHAVAEKWDTLADYWWPNPPPVGAMLSDMASAFAETCRAMAADGVESCPQSAPCDRCSDEVKTHVALCSSCYAQALLSRIPTTKEIP
jgi:hypothetical protein